MTELSRGWVWDGYGRIWDTILITELSRLSRSVTDFLNFVNEIEKLGCDFICLQYDFDTTSPAGKVFMTIIMALAQFERELTAERIKLNFHARALRGLNNGGKPILGYSRDPINPGKMVIQHDEAAIVREIFDLYYAWGKNLSEIATKMNQSGARNKSWINSLGNPCGGKEFDFGAIWRILTNQNYTGKREVNKANKKIRQADLKSEEKYTLVDAAWEAIIDEGIFNDVQSKLSDTKKFKSPSLYKFFLSGLLNCDECGAALFGQSGKGRNGTKYFYYGHKYTTDCKIQAYPASELESLIKKQIFSILNITVLNKEFITILTDLGKFGSQDHKGLSSLKEKEINRVKKDIEKLMYIILNEPGASEIGILTKALKESEEKLKKMEQEKEFLEFERTQENEEKINENFILNAMDSLRNERFRKAKLSIKKEIAKCLFKSIHIHPDNVIRIDVWNSDRRSEILREEARGQAGIVLPFQKLGRPLESSFSTEAFGGFEFRDVRKELGIGIFVNRGISPDRVGGSSVILNGGAIKITDKLLSHSRYISVFIPHFLSNPTENCVILRKLYLDYDLNMVQISQITGWPRTTIVDAIRDMSLIKDRSYATRPQYGEKIVKGRKVPNLTELKVIEKVTLLKKKGLSLKEIVTTLKKEKISTKSGGVWSITMVQKIINRRKEEHL